MRISDWSSDVCSSDLVLVVQYMRQCAGNARTRTAERMAERDRTTADVDAVHALGELEVFQHGDRLCGKRFVEFEVVDVAAIQTGTLQRLLRRRPRTDAHDRRVAAGRPHPADHGARLEAPRPGPPRRHTP